MQTHRSELSLLDVVCLKLDEDKHKGLITGIIIRHNATAYYWISWGNTRTETAHHLPELELLEQSKITA